MRRYQMIALLVVACAGLLRGQSGEKPAVLMSGLGNLHHPVSTQNAEAQQIFDQGLRLIYAFNHDEAARSFQRAAELDPQLAMAWWGVGTAVGPNYNLPVDAEHEKIAVNAVNKALADPPPLRGASIICLEAASGLWLEQARLTEMSSCGQSTDGGGRVLPLYSPGCLRLPSRLQPTPKTAPSTKNQNRRST